MSACLSVRHFLSTCFISQTTQEMQVNRVEQQTPAILMLVCSCSHQIPQNGPHRSPVYKICNVYLKYFLYCVLTRCDTDSLHLHLRICSKRLSDQLGGGVQDARNKILKLCFPNSFPLLKLFTKSQKFRMKTINIYFM